MDTVLVCRKKQCFRFLTVKTKSKTDPKQFFPVCRLIFLAVCSLFSDPCNSYEDSFFVSLTCKVSASPSSSFSNRGNRQICILLFNSSMICFLLNCSTADALPELFLLYLILTALTKTFFRKRVKKGDSPGIGTISFFSSCSKKQEESHPDIICITGFFHIFCK